LLTLVNRITKKHRIVSHFHRINNAKALRLEFIRQSISILSKFQSVFVSIFERHD